MTLQEFLNKVGGNESDIVEYQGNEVVKAVEQDGYALRYVKKSVFQSFLEITLKDIEIKFGCSVKIVKEEEC